MLLHRHPSLVDKGPQNGRRSHISTSAPGLSSLWSRPGLDDFLLFHTLFLKMDILYGRPVTRFLVELSVSLLLHMGEMIMSLVQLNLSSF